MSDNIKDHPGISEKSSGAWYGKEGSGGGAKNSFSGTHVGYVVDDVSPTNDNTVWVYIPAHSAMSYDPAKIRTTQGTATDRQGSDNTQIDQQLRQGWIKVQSGRPSSGTEQFNATTVDGRNPFNGDTNGGGITQPAYRNGASVYVAFAGGDPSKGIIHGAIPKLGGESTMPHGGTAPQSTLTNSSKSPITDKASPDACLPYTEKHPTKADPGGAKRGVSTPNAKHIVRGGTSKSAHRNPSVHAHRESPSLVSGHKSHGWNYARDQNNRDAAGNQWKNRGSNIKRHMNNGHALSFDDSPDGSGIILRSGHNAGLIIKDGVSNPFIHMSTTGGKVYISLDDQGNLEMYGKTNMSFHCEKDMNFMADGDINFQSNKELNLLANGINLTSNKDYNVAVNGDYKAVYAQASDVNVLGDDKKEVKGNYSLTMKAGAIESKGNYDITAKDRVAIKTDMASIKATTFAVDTTGNIMLNCGSSVDVNAPAIPDFAKFKKLTPKANAPSQDEILKGDPSKKQSKAVPGRLPQHQPDGQAPGSDTQGTGGSVAPQQQGNNAAAGTNPSTNPSTNIGGPTNSNYTQAPGITNTADAQQAIADANTNGKWISGGADAGSQQCVALVKYLAPDVGATPTWSQGDQVMGNTNLPVGTAIATFNSNGVYTGEYGSSHAAIYLGQDSNGIQVLDQSNLVPATIRTIPFSKAGAEGGSMFYTIN